MKMGGTSEIPKWTNLKTWLGCIMGNIELVGDGVIKCEAWSMERGLIHLSGMGLG